MQHIILCVISYELTGLRGVHFKEFMYVKESRTRSSFCTSTRINCCNKHQEAFCYITRENTRAVHEFSNLYKGQYFTGTVLEVDLWSNRAV